MEAAVRNGHHLCYSYDSRPLFNNMPSKFSNVVELPIKREVCQEVFRTCGIAYGSFSPCVSELLSIARCVRKIDDIFAEKVMQILVISNS